MTSTFAHHAHGKYLTGLLARRLPLWSPFLEIGCTALENEEHERAAASFSQALLTVEDLMATGDEPSALRLKSATLLCLGIQALAQKNLPRALDFFRRCEDTYMRCRESYGRAIALLAIATIYELRQEWREVFQFYERSERAVAVMGEAEDVLYLRQCIKDKRSLAIKEWRRSMGDDPDGDKAETNVSGKSASKTKDKSADSLAAIPLEFLPVFGRIPAGNPYPVPKSIVGYIETDRLFIEGKPYTIRDASLPRVRLSFSPEFMYVALQVDGDSMNKAKIFDGDFVLLQMPRLAVSKRPENGEIVAVVLPDQEHITLKRFRRVSEDRVVFEPESTNPNHPSYEHKCRGEYDIGYKVVGTVVAVLAPMPLD